MKKLLVCLMVILLCGCSAPASFETVGDDYVGGERPVAQEIQLTFPSDTAVETMESQSGICYICDSYTVSLQTLESGNLDESIRILTGLPKEKLTVIKTQQGDLQRYDAVWASVSERGDQTGRLVILDDGDYHYGVSVMADAAVAGELTDQWNELLNAIRLISTG